MSNERGITLSSLMVYVIGMLVVVGIIGVITSYFYKNVDIENINDNTQVQYTNFSSLFTNEINKKDNKIIDCITTGENENKISYIIFSSGNQYTFKAENKSIYKNKIKICENIEDCDFSYEYIDSKYKIKVNFKTQKLDLSGEKAIIYIL